MEEEDGDDFTDEFGELGIMSEVTSMSDVPSTTKYSNMEIAINVLTCTHLIELYVYY